MHRLWEPLASKHRPPNDYAAKFSTPFNIAGGFVPGGAGLDAFTEATVRDERVLALASRCATSSIRAILIRRPTPATSALTLKDGSVVEERQPYIRGGAHDPLTRAEIEDKFARNAPMAAGTRRAATRRWRSRAALYGGRIDLSHGCGDEAITVRGLLRTSGQVAIVTGAGRNIGRAIALTLADGGAAVVVNARSNHAEAEAVADEIEAKGGKALVVIADVADRRCGRRRWRDARSQASAGSTILVNNAALRRERRDRRDGLRANGARS